MTPSRFRVFWSRLSSAGVACGTSKRLGSWKAGAAVVRAQPAWHGERTGGGGLVNRLLLPPHATLTPCPHLRLQPRQLVLVHAAPTNQHAERWSVSAMTPRFNPGLADISRRQPSPLAVRRATAAISTLPRHHLHPQTQPRAALSPLPNVRRRSGNPKRPRSNQTRGVSPRFSSHRSDAARVHCQRPFFFPPSGRAAPLPPSCVVCACVCSGGCGAVPAGGLVGNTRAAKSTATAKS